MADKRESDSEDSEHKRQTLLNQTEFVTAIHSLARVIALSAIGNAPP